MNKRKYVNSSIIEEYIKRNKLSIKEFCRQCNISISTYYRIINDKNVYSTAVFKIAKKMNIKLHELFP